MGVKNIKNKFFGSLSSVRKSSARKRRKNFFRVAQILFSFSLLTTGYDFPIYFHVDCGLIVDRRSTLITHHVNVLAHDG
jgi:hypothetical protein